MIVKFLCLFALLNSFVYSSVDTESSELSKLHHLYSALSRAAVNGGEELRGFFASYALQLQLKEFDGFEKFIANNMLNVFSEHLVFNIEKSSPDFEKSDETLESVEAMLDSFLDYGKVKEIILEIESLLKAAWEKGMLAFKEFLESEKLKNLIKKLPEHLQEIVRKWIRKVDQGEESLAAESAFDSAFNSVEFRDLWSRILAKYTRGSKYLSDFVQGDGFKLVYRGLSAEEKSEIDQLLSDLLKEQTFADTRNLIIDPAATIPAFGRNFRDLWSQILSKHAIDKLEDFVHSEGFKLVYESLHKEEKAEIDDLLKQLMKPTGFADTFNLDMGINFRDLWSQILSKHTSGKLEDFVNSEGFKLVYDSLNQEEKAEIDDLLKQLMKK